VPLYNKIDRFSSIVVMEGLTKDQFGMKLPTDEDYTIPSDLNGCKETPHF
jgi:hypothetical protein